MRKRGIAGVIVILLLAVAFGRGDPNQFKLTTLLVTGCISLGVLFLLESRWLLGCVAFLLAGQLLRTDGMSIISLSSFFCIACFLGLLYVCEKVSDVYIKGAICTAAIIQALYGIMQVWYEPIFSIEWVNNQGYVIPESWRIMGTFGQRQFWLMFLGAAVPLFFYKGFNQWFRRAGLATIGIAYGLYYSVIREIGFVEIAALIVLLVYLSRFVPRFIYLAPVLILLAILCFQYRWQIYYNPATYVDITEPIKVRAKTAKLTYELISLNWTTMLTGYGLGTYKYIMPQYEKQPGKQIFPKHVLAAAHNEYLQAWFELGIVGLLASLLAFIYVLAMCYGATSNLPYWYSLLFIGLFAWVHFPLHLSFMSVFLLKGGVLSNGDGRVYGA
jgi:hypothetical protein